jgi:hypothetical protein
MKEGTPECWAVEDDCSCKEMGSGRSRAGWITSLLPSDKLPSA